MTRIKTKWPNTKAILKLEIEFDALPDKNEIAEILNKSRETGGVSKATLSHLTFTEEDVLSWY